MNLRPFASHALRLSLGVFLLPLALTAGDAVTVNSDGTTKFTYTVAGPNLLATAAPVAISGATTLDATAAGKIYTISGTTGNYAITLPPATIGDGTVIAFSVAPWASANKQYTLTPVSGQTLDGRPSTNGLVLIHTNYLEVMSVGGQWVSRVKKVDTDWVNGGPIQITGSTASPSKGAVGLDKVTWRRSGASLIAKYNYRQTSAGTSGGGTMLLALPAGFAADPSAATSTSPDLAQAGAAAIGTACGTETTVIKPGVAILYDANRFAMACAIVYFSDTSNRGGVLSSGYWGGLASPSLSLYADIEVPISGW